MNRLTQTLRALLPSCQEAIRLQSDALDQKLPLSRRIGLRFHLSICVWCARYGRQLMFLRAAAQQCDQDPAPEPTLPPAARERIKRRLQADTK